MARSVKLSKERVEDLLLRKGWSVSKLADAAVVSKRTLEKALTGDKILVTTLGKIAKVFNVDGKTLLHGYRPSSNDDGVERIVINLHLDCDRETLERLGIAAILKELIAKTRLKSEVTLKGTEEGSMKLKLEVTVSDARRIASGAGFYKMLDEIAGIKVLDVTLENGIPLQDYLSVRVNIDPQKLPGENEGGGVADAK
jgi:transcriptional regulator with XRE-family HTH domain